MSRRNWFLLLGGIFLVCCLVAVLRDSSDDLAFLKPYATDDRTEILDYTRVAAKGAPAFVRQRIVTLSHIKNRAMLDIVDQHYAHRKGWSSAGTDGSFSTGGIGPPHEGDEYVYVLFASTENISGEVVKGHYMSPLEILWARVTGAKFVGVYP